MANQVVLGRSGLRTSRVVLGSMTLGLGGDAEARRRRLDTLVAAVEAGVTGIDTAPLYEFGRCEELVGEALRELKALGLRDRVQVLTKVGLRWSADARGDVLFRAPDGNGGERVVRKDSRPEAVRADVEESLRRLGVETLDLVQVHHPDPHTPIPETMGALAQLQREGKLRAIGVSNYGAAQMRQAQAALGQVPLASNQVHYSLVERWPERDLLPTARELGVSVMAYSPLEAGLLRGAPPREALKRGDPRLEDARFHPDNVKRVHEAMTKSVVPIARDRSVEPAQVALSYLLAQPALDVVVVGASSPEQARQNAAAGGLHLREEELRTISRAFAHVSIDPHATQTLLWRLSRRVTRLPSRVKGKVSRVLRGVSGG